MHGSCPWGGWRALSAIGLGVGRQQTIYGFSRFSLLGLLRSVDLAHFLQRWTFSSSMVVVGLDPLNLGGISGPSRYLSVYRGSGSGLQGSHAMCFRPKPSLHHSTPHKRATANCHCRKTEPARANPVFLPLFEWLQPIL